MNYNLNYVFIQNVDKMNPSGHKMDNCVDRTTWSLTTDGCIINSIYCRICVKTTIINETQRKTVYLLNDQYICCVI